MRSATKLGPWLLAATFVWATAQAHAQFGLYFDLVDLEGSNAKQFIGELRFSCTGWRSVLGDLNNDGYDDLIIAAPCSGRVHPTYGDEFPGTVYVVFGGSWFNDVVRAGVEELDGTNGFVVEGPEPAGLFGVSTVSGFDWNGDGIDDLAVGAPGIWAGPNDDAGKVFVIFAANYTGSR